MSDEPMACVLGDTARLAVLAETGLLDADPNETLDRYVRIGRLALGTPLVAVSLVDGQRQFYSNADELPDPAMRSLPLSHSLCKHVVTSEEDMIIEHTPADPRVRDNPAVTDLGLAAYAGTPIRTLDGYVLGSFCALDRAPRAWTDRDRVVLRELAACVSAELELLRRAVRAEASEQRLARANVELVRSSDPDGARQTQGVLHDLATPLNVLMLGLDELREHAGVRGYAEIAQLLRVMKRSAGHAKTVLARGRPSSGAHHSPERLDVAAVLREVCEEVGRGRGPAIECRAPESLMSTADATDLRRCIENLLGNARRFATSRIRAEVAARGGDVELSVEDDGDGLPSADAYARVWEERARFDDERSQEGLGLAVVRELVERAGGCVSAAPSKELGGARFTLRLPANP